MQGPKVTIIDADESVSALKNYLLLKKLRVVKGSEACFSNLFNGLENAYNLILSEDLKSCI